jgi:deoxyribonuclease-4
MGKNNQMGTLEEVLEVCRVSERLIPTIDFGHLNARGQGYIKTADDYEQILDKIENALGSEVLKKFHSHFSMIEYTAGGEKKHLSFDRNNGFGPPYEPLMELIAKKNLAPTFICESDGTQADDALKMKQAYVDNLSQY